MKRLSSWLILLTTGFRSSSRFLSKTERTAFLATWEAYENDCRAAKFTDLGLEHRTRREKANRVALGRLYKILKFADYERDENAQHANPVGPDSPSFFFSPRSVAGQLSHLVSLK